MCEHDWQYSDFGLHKVCAKCGSVMRYDQDENSGLDEDRVARAYRIADLPDPMAAINDPKIWGSQ